jgi:hypothetical protein
VVDQGATPRLSSGTAHRGLGQLSRQVAALSIAKVPMCWREESSSQPTLRWREMDSNHRSPVAIGQVRTPEGRSPGRKYLHSLGLGVSFNSGLPRGSGSHLPPPASQERTPPVGEPAHDASGASPRAHEHGAPQRVVSRATCSMMTSRPVSTLATSVRSRSAWREVDGCSAGVRTVCQTVSLVCERTAGVDPSPSLRFAFGL